MGSDFFPISMTLAEWRRSNPTPAVKPINGLRLGLDIDGTITADPKLFAEISTHCREHGGQVHIVTSRSEAGRRETVLELQGYGIQYDRIQFIDEMSRANDDCPHKELDWYRRYLWQKVAYAKRHGLMHFVDDDPKVLSLFATYAPGIVATSALNRVKIADPLYELAVKVVLTRQEGSISLIQRHLKLGYTRTVKLMEAMVEAKIVSQPTDEEGLRSIQVPFVTAKRPADFPTGETQQLGRPAVDQTSSGRDT